MKRLLVPSVALLWGLQFAFLNPALALLLVALYDASPGEVGTVLAVYNASGFIASIVVPAHADRRRDYLRPMLVCGLLTVVLTAVLALTTSLPLAMLALVLMGGPASVGNSLLFAHLKHSGASTSDVMNTRAIVSFAWVAGPPLATVVIGSFGNRAVLLAIALVAVSIVVITAAMLARRPAGEAGRAGSRVEAGGRLTMSRAHVALIVVVFVVLQATNNAVVSVMSLFVTRSLGLGVVWAGIALAVAAGLEIPALLLVGRLSRSLSDVRLIASGCVTGIAYYAAMAYVTGPELLLGLQVLNAWFFAVVAGVGLTLFQRVIPRPGLASGVYANTRRLGAIASGLIIALGSSTSLGYSGVFLTCTALTAAALVLLQLSRRVSDR